jgi:hypothetical protein
VAAGLIALSTFILLFLMFGSILVPLKAIVLNLLSLTATFGAMVWVFQDGDGAGLLGFTATGLTDTTTPILMFCIAFGLSMDYDPNTRALHAMAYAWPDWLEEMKVQYVVVGEDGRVGRTVDIPVSGMIMIHDMSLTDRYAVVYDLPVTVDFDLATANRFPFVWNDDYEPRVGLLPPPRHGRRHHLVCGAVVLRVPSTQRLRHRRWAGDHRPLSVRADVREGPARPLR